MNNLKVLSEEHVIERSRIKQEVYDITEDSYGNFQSETQLDVPEYVNVTLISSTTETSDDFLAKRTEDKKSSKKIVNQNIKQEPKEETEPQVKTRKKYVPKPRTCNQCGQQLSCTKSLLVHMRIHTNERPFKCDICDKAFTQRGGLTTHMLTHSKEKSYKCQVIVI